MVIKPFVENVVWLGLMNKNGGEPGEVEIDVTENKGRLRISFEDNRVVY